MKPKISDIVHVFSSSESPTPMPGIVCAVHSDVCVNLAIFDPNGGSFARTSVMKRGSLTGLGTCWDWPAVAK